MRIASPRVRPRVLGRGDAAGKKLSDLVKAEPLPETTAESRDAKTDHRLFIGIREPQENLKFLKRPGASIPKMAWPGRMTLWAAPEKSGKSSTIS